MRTKRTELTSPDMRGETIHEAAEKTNTATEAVGKINKLTKTSYEM